jgi:ornithine cyclodeaminase/alanine dehydrogenase-like protein (mu-crystallin family)
LIILRAEDIRQALPMGEAVETMKKAYAAVSRGEAIVPLRISLPISPYEGVSLFMPAYVGNKTDDALALKAVSVFPKNADLGLPIIHAAVLVLEAATGRVIALLEGASLTAIRTGAASGAATDLLSRGDAENVVVFGAGIQGRTQLQAVCEVRSIKKGWVYDPATEKAHAFIKELAGEGPIPSDLQVASDPGEVAGLADIICTATTSKDPVYPADAVKPGTHINGVGSYTLEMVENPPELFGKAGVFVDSVGAVMAEAGEIVEAINRKIIRTEDLVELGNVVRGVSTGRRSSEQITFFKSVGIAVQDALAAQLAVQRAIEMELGQKVDW